MSVKFHPPGTTVRDVLGDLGHAWRAGTLAEALIASLLLCGLNDDDHTHWIYSSRGGRNSYRLDMADGRAFFFRGGTRKAPYDTIEVYDRYHRNGHAPVVVLASREDIWAWTASLSFNVFIAKKNGMPLRASA
jgi:hypothetical protein